MLQALISKKSHSTMLYRQHQSNQWHMRCNLPRKGPHQAGLRRSPIPLFVSVWYCYQGLKLQELHCFLIQLCSSYLELRGSPLILICKIIIKMGNILDACMRNDTESRKSEFRYEPKDSERNILSFRDYKGFKKTGDITKKYLMKEALGKGSFGEVRLAHHIQADVACAIKIIKKNSISRSQILLDLMHNELQVLEETVRYKFNCRPTLTS